MLPHKKQRLWTIGLLVLTLFSFLAETSLACLQKGTGNITMAKECCQSHCQHAMTGDAAVKCCQSHQRDMSQAVPLPLGVKPVLLADSSPFATIIFVPLIYGQDSGRDLLFTTRRPPPSPPFYTLHCTLLI